MNEVYGRAQQKPRDKKKKDTMSETHMVFKVLLHNVYRNVDTEKHPSYASTCGDTYLVTTRANSWPKQTFN